jgi:hypothetical protein
MRACVSCGRELPADMRADAICCSNYCRLRHLRARRRGAKLSVSPHKGEGYVAVTDNARPVPSAPPSGAPSKWTEEELRIPDDLTIPKFLRREPDAPHWKDYDQGDD